VWIPHRQSLPVFRLRFGQKAWLVAIGLIALVAQLIASLVGLLVLVFLELPLPEMISVMRFVILAVSHAYLVVPVFRIILIVSLVAPLILRCWRRRSPYGAPGHTATQHNRHNPDALR
jgi:hypothetical protein